MTSCTTTGTRPSSPKLICDNGCMPAILSPSAHQQRQQLDVMCVRVEIPGPDLAELPAGGGQIGHVPRPGGRVAGDVEQPAGVTGRNRAPDFLSESGPRRVDADQLGT